MSKQLLPRSVMLTCLVYIYNPIGMSLITELEYDWNSGMDYGFLCTEDVTISNVAILASFIPRGKHQFKPVQGRTDESRLGSNSYSEKPGIGAEKCFRD